jgi:hypothetical protein
MPMAEPSLPSLSFDVEATPSGADRASAWLSDFAARHRVDREVRATAGPVVADVVRVVASAFAGRMRVEADLAEEDLQVVIVPADGGPPAGRHAGLRRRLAEIGPRCDGFDVERAGASGLEVWCCFRLRARAAASRSASR